MGARTTLLLLHVRQRCLGHADAGARDVERRVRVRKRRAKVARFEPEQRRAGFDVVAGAHQNIVDGAGEVRADADVLAARLDQADRGDGMLKFRGGRWRGWIGSHPSRLHAGNSDRRNDGDDNGQDRKN